MKVRFNLKSKKSDPALIILKYRYQRGHLPFVYSTRQHVPIEYWDVDNNRARKNRKFPQYRELNIFLDLLAAETQKIVLLAPQRGEVVTKQLLKKRLDQYLNITPPVQRVQQQNFLSYQLDWIERHKNLKSKGTIKAYGKRYTITRKYIQAKGVSKNMKEMNLTWWKGFIEYMVTQKYHPNTIAKTISSLKTILRDAVSEGQLVNMDFENKKVSFSKVPAKKNSRNKVYLSITEIEAIRDIDLTEHPELERTRDIAILGLRTGLACTDFSNLSLDNIITIAGVPTINKNRQKTGNTALIPIHPEVAAIIQKYNGFPPVYTNQTLNRKLKTLCQLAKINTPFIFTHYEGRSQRQEKKLKYELVGTHTFRRSFITNLLLEGKKRDVIMSMTGITEMETIETYNCLTPEELLVIGSRADFFQTKNLKVVA